MELKLVLESILFSSQKPLSIAELRACIKEAPGYAEEPIPTELQQVKTAVLEQTLEDLSRDINAMGAEFSPDLCRRFVAVCECTGVCGLDQGIGWTSPPRPAIDPSRA